MTINNDIIGIMVRSSPPGKICIYELGSCVYDIRWFQVTHAN